MRILFIGDVYGSAGRDVLFKQLPLLKAEHRPNVIIVNAENAAHGRGITEKIYKQMMELGVTCITMGNHTFTNSNIFNLFDAEAKIIRPANLVDAPGKGYITIKYNDKTFTIVNLLGKTFMSLPQSSEYKTIDCPFATMDKILSEVKSDFIFVDFHGEATSEKVAFGLDFDGKVSAIIGTHTHVPTADDRFLPKGTAYQTDTGMTGVLNGAIGVEPQIVIDRFRNGYSARNVPLEDSTVQLNGILIDLAMKKMKRINIIDKL